MLHTTKCSINIMYIFAPRIEILFQIALFFKLRLIIVTKS